MIKKDGDRDCELEGGQGKGDDLEDKGELTGPWWGLGGEGRQGRQTNH